MLTSRSRNAASVHIILTLVLIAWPPVNLGGRPFFLSRGRWFKARRQLLVATGGLGFTNFIAPARSDACGDATSAMTTWSAIAGFGLWDYGVRLWGQTLFTVFNDPKNCKQGLTPKREKVITSSGVARNGRREVDGTRQHTKVW